MKILHIYKDYFPVMGGIENHIRLLAEGQAARGHEVSVLVTSLDRHTHVEQMSGVQIIFASRLFNLSSAPFSLDLFRRVADEAPDIAHMHSPYPIGEVAKHWFGHARATVLTYHSDIVRQKVMGALYTPMLHRVLARADRIIATSPNYVTSSPVLRHWREKCVVIPLASALSTYSQNSAARHPGSERCNLLFVGRLRYYKGLNYLLEALKQMPGVTLTVVGSGPMEAEWKRLAATLGIAPRVRWAGEVSDDELAAYYAECEIFVLPCSERSEAFGAVQLEAMAAGKPVISCDVNTGVAWVNQKEVTGLVIPPKDLRALGAAITRLLNDPALRARMGAAGKARVQAEFTLDQMVERVLLVYNEVLRENRPFAS